MLITETVALEPYKTEDAPFRISIDSIFSDAKKSKVCSVVIISVTSFNGIPSTKINTLASFPP